MEKPGLVDVAGQVRDLSGYVADIDGKALSPDSLEVISAVDPSSLPLVSGVQRFGPPVSGVGKIVAIGLNYSDHAAEAGLNPPAEPVLFMKGITSISGPNDDVIIPPNSTKTDWEVELAIVVGSRARHVHEADALDYIAGYTICNDVSERAYQLERLGQWVKGKSYDSFAPLGPWIVTKDEISDPQALSMWLDVNGERMQEGSTADMIFNVSQLVSYISQFMTLLPGDVISTGTPAGVGLGKKPQRFLKVGDRIRLGITGLGEQHQTCITETVERD